MQGQYNCHRASTREPECDLAPMLVIGGPGPHVSNGSSQERQQPCQRAPFLAASPSNFITPQSCESQMREVATNTRVFCTFLGFLGNIAARRGGGEEQVEITRLQHPTFPTHIQVPASSSTELEFSGLFEERLSRTIDSRSYITPSYANTHAFTKRD